MKFISITGLTLFLIEPVSSVMRNTPARLPIIFSKNYDVTLFGIEKLHPFDTEKFSKTHKYLMKKLKLRKDQFYSPEMISEEDLLLVHTTGYLASLNTSHNIAKIIELGILALFPNYILNERLLKPMKYATGGTVLAGELALKYGWAINLSGGYHHAKADSGGGFCFYADVPVAVYKLWKDNPKLKVLIIDLDAHQGNGNESIFRDDPRVDIFDVYNESIYPFDEEVKKYIKYHFPIKTDAEWFRNNQCDEKYLALLQKNIPVAIEKSKPGLIVYNAGTDIYQKDPLGSMGISEEGIIKRDEIVFKNALKNKIPVLMILSGGYTAESAGIIAGSIDNILKNVIRWGDLKNEN
ncbi:MAG: histone deacetylase [Elusimicrobiota bacterium]